MFNIFEYLNTQFTDLESAKKWYHKWWDEWDQELVPDKRFPDMPIGAVYSMRSMAYYVSLTLEGVLCEEDDAYFTDYMSTKYGSEIYFS